MEIKINSLYDTNKVNSAILIFLGKQYGNIKYNVSRYIKRKEVSDSKRKFATKRQRRPGGKEAIQPFHAIRNPERGKEYHRVGRRLLFFSRV